MTALILDGKAASAAVKSDLTERCARLAERGVVPGLATILVGDDPGSHSYVSGKHKASAAVLDVGITRTEARGPGGSAQKSVLVGDVAPDVRDVAGWLAPMPGGVGPMTIALLLRNAVEAAERRAGI